MATIAKHIKIARTEGPEAGMEAYLSAPSSKIHPAYQRITRKRSQESRIKAYCTEFADKLGSAVQRTPVQQERFEGDVQTLSESIMAQVTAQVQSALAGILGTSTDDEHDEVLDVMNRFGVSRESAEKIVDSGALVADEPFDQESVPESVVTTAADSAQARVSRKRKAPAGAITAGEAWIALGGGETFEPNDPDKEANSGQLYRLNVQGKLALVS